MSPNFTFNPENPVSRIPNDFVYSIPDGQEVEEFVALIDSFPTLDSPEIFGLHPNADLTFRVKEVQGVLNSLGQTQPKNATSSDSGGETKDETVMNKATDFLSKLPETYNDDDVREKIQKIGGLGSPLTIVLFQEVQRMQNVIRRVRAALTQLQQAIKGEVVVTKEVLNVLDAIYDARVPHSWMYSAGGDELSWLCPALGMWFASLLQRDNQLHTWLNTGRPNCFWISGFTNPQGFLTAMKQEVTRQHKTDKWALDDVVFHTEVTEYERVEQVRQAPREGVFCNGLFLEGCGWGRSEGSLVESEPKKLFVSLPVLFVTALTKAQKKNRSGDYGPYGGYECPCYKYPARTGRHFIFMVTLPTKEQKPGHWILRGVALLCHQE